MYEKSRGRLRGLGRAGGREGKGCEDREGGIERGSFYETNEEVENCGGNFCYRIAFLVCECCILNVRVFCSSAGGSRDVAASSSKEKTADNKREKHNHRSSFINTDAPSVLSSD